MKTVRIDIISDVMCPWCAVGFYNLKQALEQLKTSIKADIHWQPFELNPNAAPEGEDMVAHLIQKYGMTAEQSKQNRAMITERGAQAGFRFDFIEGMRMWNTFNAHQLLHWAGLPENQLENQVENKAGLGIQTELKIALFEAHFQQHKNVSDIQFLSELAGQVGLNTAQAKRILEQQTYAQAVRESEQKWQQSGIRSVPAFIFEQKYLVSGGQPPEAFVALFNEHFL